MARITVGIDEAGRGPLAGPLVVAGVAQISGIRLRGIKDSKKISARKREKWHQILRAHGVCRYVSISHEFIDRHGIARAVRVAVSRLLRRFPEAPHMVLLDGSMRAPKRYRQRTVIKGDERIPLIAAASIIAKVARDRKMIKLHTEYAQYGFDAHKGYGTKQHVERIKKYGFSPVHRRTFCTRL